MKALLPLIVAYAAGCVSFAGLVCRLHGVDVRRHGSGNPGATNVGRLLGPRWGRAVLVADILKGLLPVLLLRVDAPLSVSPWVSDSAGRALVMAAAVLGHVAPVSTRFRGGKGVATWLGGLLGYAPGLAAGALIVHVAVRKRWGYVSMASVAMAWAAPALATLAVPLGLRAPDGTLVLAALALLLTLRHAENFGRIRSGTESRHGQRVRVDASVTSHTDGN